MKFPADRTAPDPTADTVSETSDGRDRGRTQSPMPSSSGGIFQMVAVVIVLGAGLLIFGKTKWDVLRGGPGFRPDPRLGQIVARRTLTNRHAIHFVRVGSDILLIGTGPGGSPNILARYDQNQLDASQEAVDPAEIPADADSTECHGPDVSFINGPRAANFPLGKTLDSVSADRSRTHNPPQHREHGTSPLTATGSGSNSGRKGTTFLPKEAG